MLRKEQKLAVLERIKEFEAVAQSIIDGETINNACKAHNISQKLYDEFRRGIFDAYEGEVIDKRLSKDCYSWEESFMYNLLGENAEVRADFHEAFKEALNSLPSKEAKIIKLVYVYGYTIEEASYSIGEGQSKASFIYFRAMSMLRHPSRSDVFLHGVQKAEEKLPEEVDLETIEVFRKRAIEECRKKINTVIHQLSRINVEYDKRNLNAVVPAQDISIRCMGLSVRLYNVLDKNNIETLADIVSHPFNYFTKMKGMGNNSADELYDKVHWSYGMRFKGEDVSEHINEFVHYQD